MQQKETLLHNAHGKKEIKEMKFKCNIPSGDNFYPEDVVDVRSKAIKLAQEINDNLPEETIPLAVVMSASIYFMANVFDQSIKEMEPDMRESFLKLTNMFINSRLSASLEAQILEEKSNGR
jgi:hypoxanthine-guanine phosphoribosyltransferase